MIKLRLTKYTILILLARKPSGDESIRRCDDSNPSCPCSNGCAR